MNTVLVPTDFSKSSLNAVKYAAEMALQLDARLILLNVFPLPVIVNDPASFSMMFEELRRISERQLQKLKSSLTENKRYKKIPVSWISDSGDAEAGIRSCSARTKANLIVMGKLGTGVRPNIFFGSVSEAVAKKTLIPAMFVGPNMKFRKLKKIVFADDRIEIKPLSILQPLLSLCHVFSSEIYLLHIIDPEEGDDHRAAYTNRLNMALGTIPHSTYVVRRKNIVTGLNGFVHKNNADLLVMVPRKHSLFERVVSRSKTIQMLEKTDVPMLAVPARAKPEKKSPEPGKHVSV